MKCLSGFAAALLLLAAPAAPAQDTNTLSDAEIQGRALVQKILQQWPTENTTNTGVLMIKKEDGKRLKLPLTFFLTVTSTNWQSYYTVDAGTNDLEFTSLVVVHNPSGSNNYYVSGKMGVRLALGTIHPQMAVSGDYMTIPFAGSDFSVGDLGLEFFHWPQQKVLKKEVHRSCGCTVLESTNPDPATNGYSRVVSWIDSESLGIVEAYAYDARGKVLKDFYPKDLKKVNGRYEVQTMVMENNETDTRTRLEFDLEK